MTAQHPLCFDAAHRTALGPRHRNEDSARASCRHLAIADGVGGGPAGDTASQLACGAAMAALARAHRSPAAALHVAFVEAGLALRSHAQHRCSDVGLATTLSLATLGPTRADGRTHAFIAWSGDSAIWVVRARLGQPERIGGDLPSDDGRLRGWVSSGRCTEPSIHQVELEPGDLLILATDGLEVLGSDPCAAIAGETGVVEPARVASQLVDDASRRGLIDNTTVVAARVVPASSRPSSPTAPLLRSRQEPSHVEVGSAQAIDVVGRTGTRSGRAELGAQPRPGDREGVERRWRSWRAVPRGTDNGEEQ
jgi:protein phosphatase